MDEIIPQPELSEEQIKKFRNEMTGKIFVLSLVIMALVDIWTVGPQVIFSPLSLVVAVVLFVLSRAAAKRARLPSSKAPETTGQNVVNAIGHALVVVLLGILVLGGILFVTCLTAFR